VFTGIVQGLAPVAELVNENGMLRIGLQLEQMSDGLQLGASVAINGTCLTATKVDGVCAHFDVIPETVRTTNLGRLQLGDPVNIERSFRVGDEIGGHFVSGHVTTTAELIHQHNDAHDRVLTFRLPDQWMKYVFHKGFITVDGASLTVSSLDRGTCSFTVSLIPETLARTTLGTIQVGDQANIEIEAQTMSVVDTVERVLAESDRG
jgi:riboflavin synthase